MSAARLCLCNKHRSMWQIKGISGIWGWLKLLARTSQWHKLLQWQRFRVQAMPACMPFKLHWHQQLQFHVLQHAFVAASQVNVAWKVWFCALRQPCNARCASLSGCKPVNSSDCACCSCATVPVLQHISSLMSEGRASPSAGALPPHDDVGVCISIRAWIPCLPPYR